MKNFTAKHRLIEAPQAKTSKIEVLMPIFGNLAQTFGVNIIVDCLEESVKLSEYSRLENDNDIFFHLDAYPDKYLLSDTISISSLFYLVPNQPIPVKIANIVNLGQEILPHSLPKTNLISPEGDIVGCILGSHIFIYPHVLTSMDWSEQERKSLVRQFGFWFMPRAIVNVLPNHRSSIEAGLNSLRSDYRNLHLINSERIKKAEKTFASFITKVNIRTTTRLETETQKNQNEIEDTLKKYFDALLQNIQNRDMLKMLKEKIVKIDLGQDFESLLGMESIETVRVEGARYILIKTSPIFQTPAIDPKTGASDSYDIGEFKIIIDTAYPKERNWLSKSSIRFQQDTYEGPFKHTHLNSDADTCFGTNLNTEDLGLNHTIDGMIGTFELVPLVQLLLTFMKKEKSKPYPRTNWVNTIRPTPDLYKNTEEREQEKGLFVSLASRILSKISCDDLENKIKQLDLVTDNLYRTLIRLKAELMNQEGMIERINSSSFYGVELKRELSLIFDDPSVFWSHVSEDCVVIYFCLRRMSSLDQAYISEDFALKLKVDSFPELLVQTTKRCFQIMALIDSDKLNSNEPERVDETVIRHLHLGKVSKILSIIKKRISDGHFDLKPTSQEVKDGQ